MPQGDLLDDRGRQQLEHVHRMQCWQVRSVHGKRLGDRVSFMRGGKVLGIDGTNDHFDLRKLRGRQVFCCSGSRII